MKQLITLIVNGEAFEIPVEPSAILLDVLREELGLMGAKMACDLGNCGSCTVLIDGKPVLACLTLAMDVRGKDIVTIEGIARNGKLNPLQEAFVEHGAIQCGFCTPGMLLSAKALLDENQQPSEQDVKEAISGNLCRCTGYHKIIAAILDVSKSWSRGK